MKDLLHSLVKCSCRNSNPTLRGTNIQPLALPHLSHDQCLYNISDYSKLCKGFVGCWCDQPGAEDSLSRVLLQRSRLLSFSGPVHLYAVLLRLLRDPKYSTPECHLGLSLLPRCAQRIQ
jgi:hypothetical protein